MNKKNYKTNHLKIRFNALKGAVILQLFEFIKLSLSTNKLLTCSSISIINRIFFFKHLIKMFLSYNMIDTQIQ